MHSDHLTTTKPFLQILQCRYGLPAYNRDGLVSLVAAILLVGCDLEWWEATLRHYAGFSRLVPKALVEDVLVQLFIPRPRAYTGFLTRMHLAFLSVSPHLRPSPLQRKTELTRLTDY